MSDLIRRQAAIDALDKIGSLDTYADLEYAKAVFKDLPTVEAVPVVHGRNTDESRLFHCSECGYGVFDAYLDDEKNYNYEYHYCPWCGAKMEGSEDAGRDE